MQPRLQEADGDGGERVARRDRGELIERRLVLAAPDRLRGEDEAAHRKAGIDADEGRGDRRGGGDVADLEPQREHGRRELRVGRIALRTKP